MHKVLRMGLLQVLLMEIESRSNRQSITTMQALYTMQIQMLCLLQPTCSLLEL
jgi:hypothetical protein